MEPSNTVQNITYFEPMENNSTYFPSNTTDEKTDSIFKKFKRSPTTIIETDSIEKYESSPLLTITSLKKSPTDSHENISQKDKQLIETLVKTCAVWEELALFKGKQCSSQEETSHFDDSEVISSCLKEDAISFYNNINTNSELIICLDNHVTIQGAAYMQHSKDQSHLVHLGTNPCNILSTVNLNDYSSIRGVGSALIYTIFQNCIEKNTPALTLTSSESATQFYKNRGLKRNESIAIASYDLSGMTPMIITLEEMREKCR